MLRGALAGGHPGARRLGTAGGSMQGGGSMHGGGSMQGGGSMPGGGSMQGGGSMPGGDSMQGGGSIRGGNRDGLRRLGSRRLHALCGGGFLMVASGVIVAAVCAGCRERGLVDYALQEAGDNRGEIEGVLARYAGADDGRRELAEYLVGNMPGLYGVSGAGMDSIEGLYRRLPRNGSWGLTEEEIEQGKRYSGMELRRMKDVETVTGSYLMANVEDALRLRRERRWNRGLPEEVFREFLLPYRRGDERLTEWRGAYRAWLSELEDTLSRTEGSVEAARIVAERIGECPYNDRLTTPHRTATDLLEAPVGYCRDDCDRTVYAMRALGIPVAVDMMIASPDNGGSHQWTVVYDTREGRTRMFDNKRYLPTSDSIHNDRRKKGKVYRMTFGFNPERLRRYRDARNAPGALLNPRLRDVTAEYFGENETEVRVRGEGDVYAGVFTGGGRYAAIDIAERRDDDVAVFRNLEPGVIYFPITADGEACGEAFMAESGEIEQGEMERVRLTRKYPVRFHQVERMGTLGGTRVQAGPTAQGPWRDLDEMSGDTDHSYKRVRHGIPVKERYLRLYKPEGAGPMVAEVIAASDRLCTERMKLSVAGGAEREAQYGKMADGDILTWVRPDAGAEDVVLRIEGNEAVEWLYVVPLNDDNYVVAGDEYELLWYGGGRWHTSGRKVAEDYAVEFEAPKGAVLWLRDLTKGREEQVFVWREGRQKFNVDL